MPALEKDWYFDYSATNEKTLKPLCLEVEKHFTLPARRLLRYFAASDDYQLRQQPPEGFGPYYRGFCMPLSSRGCLPLYLQQRFFYPPEQFAEVMPFDKMVAFDSLIYVRTSTCSDVTGCVTNYAHELQHFVQQCLTPTLSVVNYKLYKNLAVHEPDALTTDIPSERDAEIKSKRVAEMVCGVEAVRAFAEKQIRTMEEAGEHKQKGKWLFFRDVPPSTDFNLLEATLPLVEKYKGLIDFGKIDVNQPEWWLQDAEDSEIEAE
jgi:hypothetical protein